MLLTAQSLIARMGKKIGMTDDEIATILTLNKEHAFTIELSNGSSYPAYRMQHNNKLGPYKGGIRFHADVSEDEVRALSMLMSLKTAAVGLPLGGGKGGVTVNPRDLSAAELEELSRKYALHLADHIGPDKDIPAPDVNTTSEIIDWMVDEYEKYTGETNKASFTGKSLGKGGSLGRDAATGRGGVFALREVLVKLDKQDAPLTIAIQGFGNVGSYFGLIIEQLFPHLKLVAATDSSGGIYRPEGLSAQDLQDFKSEGQKLATYPEGTSITNDELLECKADIVVLAALENAITETNMQQVQSRILVELANGPIDDAAHTYFYDQSIVVIPDIIANAGGVIVSYLEWMQNKAHESWSEERVNNELETYIVKAIDAVYAYAEEHRLSLKEAAFAVALLRLTK